MTENKKGQSNSILVIVTGLSLLGLLYKNNIFISIGVGVGILSLLSKKIESAINYAWFKLAFVLGWINSRILLTIIFYIFLFPLSLLKKIFSSQDALKLKKPEKFCHFPNKRPITKTIAVHAKLNHVYKLIE